MSDALSKVSAVRVHELDLLVLPRNNSKLAMFSCGWFLEGFGIVGTWCTNYKRAADGTQNDSNAGVLARALARSRPLPCGTTFLIPFSCTYVMFFFNLTFRPVRRGSQVRARQRSREDADAAGLRHDGGVRSRRPVRVIPVARPSQYFGPSPSAPDM